jgi:hypothetical protein
MSLEKQRSKDICAFWTHGLAGAGDAVSKIKAHVTTHVKKKDEKSIGMLLGMHSCMGPDY